MQNINSKLFNLILIRYGEIWLKSKKIKSRMLKTLTKNIIFSLKKNKIPFHKYQYTQDFARILFFLKNEDINKAIGVLKKKVFGIHSISPAIRTSSILKNIINRTLEIGKDILDQNDSFAIRARRSGKHPFTSQDVAEQCGYAVLSCFKDLNLNVNLSNPKKKIFIEVRDNFTYIFTRIIKTDWGGLPIEPGKHIINMDIGRPTDSLAAFLLMKRGCNIHPIIFNLFENKKNLDSILSNWKIIGTYYNDKNLDLNIINFNPILKKIHNEISEKKYVCALCNLIRLKIISNLLKSSHFKGKIKIRGLTTGINLTNIDCCPNAVDLDILAYSNEFLDLPVFTSCIGLEIKEIIDMLNKISPYLKGKKYCPYCPKNQEFNYQLVYDLYESMNLEKYIKKELFEVKNLNIYS